MFLGYNYRIMLKNLGIVAVLALAFSLTMFAEIPRDGQQAIGQDSGDNANKQQPTPQPASIMVFPLRAANETNNKAESKKNDTDSETKNWTTSDKIAIIAAAAGVFQFTALIATILTMHWFSRRQLRAYICVRNTKAHLYDDGTIEASLEIYNCGQTPAYAMKVSHTRGLSTYPVPPIGEPPQDLRQSVSVLGSGGSTFVLAVPYKAEKVNLLTLLDTFKTKQDAVFVLRGLCVYKDIFKKTHRLRFQVIMGGPSGEPRMNTDEIGLYAVLSNDSDGNEET
jgi:hypothetical protein